MSQAQQPLDELTRILQEMSEGIAALDFKAVLQEGRSRHWPHDTDPAWREDAQEILDADEIREALYNYFILLLTDAADAWAWHLVEDLGLEETYQHSRGFDPELVKFLLERYR